MLRMPLGTLLASANSPSLARQEWCWKCRWSTRPSTYPRGRSWCCNCVRRALEAQRRLHFDPVTSIEALALVLQRNVQIVYLDVFELDSSGNVRLSTRALRKHFLWCVLLSRTSCFSNLFTYYGNGMHGNISQNEDITDRIMAFV